MKLEIIYRDEHLVAINKPPGLLVHRTPLAKNTKQVALQLFRDQLGHLVYPCHRLDRKTSGVLIFALDKETNRLMHQKFANGNVQKKYWAIVRGFTPDLGIIDYPLKSEKGIFQSALTNYKTLEKTEIDLPFGGQLTSRYSWVEIEPQTGRMHQIRKHFAHIFHPIIADRPHGCNKQNRLFKEKWNMETMMLHARSITFNNPINSTDTSIIANLPEEFLRSSKFLNFNSSFYFHQ